MGNPLGNVKKINFEGRKLWFFFSAIAALLTAVVLFVILSQVTSTTTYYVATNDIPARTEITVDMLTEVVTSTGGAPINALTLSEIESEPIYAKYKLFAGDVVAITNTGPKEPIEAGIPEGFVVATFTAPATYAAGGKIGRGDYVDLIVVQENTESGSPTASYFLQHILVLDATVDPTDSGAISADDAILRSGIPTLYSVGVSPENAAKLAIATTAQIYVVKSAVQSSDVEVPPMSIEVSLNTLNGLIEDGGFGTDNSFGTDPKKKTTTPSKPTNPTPAPETEPTVPEEGTNDGVVAPDPENAIPVG